MLQLAAKTMVLVDPSIVDCVMVSYTPTVVISSLWLKVFPPDKNNNINNQKVQITNGLLSAQAAFRFRVVSTLLAI